MNGFVSGTNVIKTSWFIWWISPKNIAKRNKSTENARKINAIHKSGFVWFKIQHLFLFSVFINNSKECRIIFTLFLDFKDLYMKECKQNPCVYGFLQIFENEKQNEKKIYIYIL